MYIDPSATARSSDRSSDPSASPGAGRGVTTQRVSSSSGGAVFRLVKSTDARITGSMPVWGAPTSPEETVSQTLANSLSTSKLGTDTHMALALTEQQDTVASDESFGFLDVIDMINPLQHIPIVSTIYRAVTGDQIKPVSQIVGGAAFGGIIGAVGGIANAIVSTETGKDIGENVLGFVMGEPPGSSSAPSDTTVAVASLSYRQPHYNE